LDTADNYHLSFKTSQCRIQFSDFPIPAFDFHIPHSLRGVGPDGPYGPEADFRIPTSEFRIPASEFHIPASDFRIPTSDFRIPTSDFKTYPIE